MDIDGEKEESKATGTTKPKVPKEPQTKASESPAPEPSRDDTIAPTPAAGAEAAGGSVGPMDAEARRLPSGALKPLISLVGTTTTSESEREGGNEGLEMKDESLIETPDRSPEVPNTADKAFIKDSGAKTKVWGRGRKRPRL